MPQMSTEPNVFDAISVRICPKISAKVVKNYTYPECTPSDLPRRAVGPAGNGRWPSTILADCGRVVRHHALLFGREWGGATRP